MAKVAIMSHTGGAFFSTSGARIGQRPPQATAVAALPYVTGTVQNNKGSLVLFLLTYLTYNDVARVLHFDR
jgi:hypothetical protein